MTILYVPKEGDPHGVLAEGKHGSWPPVRFRCGCGEWGCKNGCATALNTPRAGALVLAWQDEIAPEGCYRAALLLGHKLSAEWIGRSTVLVEGKGGFVLSDVSDDVSAAMLVPYVLAGALKRNLGGEVVVLP